MKMAFLLCAVTYRCNARCSFCDIWKKKPVKELKAKYYKALPKFRSVNITGGEPFLRKDLVEVVRIFNKKADRIVISSNGLLPEVIEKTVKQMPKVGVRISIDGIGKKHDKIRGVPRAYDRAVDSVKRLKKIGVKDLGIAFTIGKNNADHLLKVYELAQRLDVEFTCAAAHDSSLYFGGGKRKLIKNPALVKKQLRELEKKQFSLGLKNWFRAYFTDGLIDYIDGKKRRLPCTAGNDFFYLDPYGNVYPCHILDKKLGNITKKDFVEIVKNSREKNISKTCPCNCWMVCTVAPSMRKKIWKPIAWIVKKKLLG